MPCKNASRSELYHYTTLSRFLEILGTDLLKATQGKHDTVNGVSTTRSAQFNWRDSSVRLTLDGNKIRSRHKIVPFSYYGSKELTSKDKDDSAFEESEEVIVGDLRNLHLYIKAIDSRFADPDIIEAIEQYIERHNLSIELGFGNQSLQVNRRNVHLFAKKILNKQQALDDINKRLDVTKNKIITFINSINASVSSLDNLYTSSKEHVQRFITMNVNPITYKYNSRYEEPFALFADMTSYWEDSNLKAPLTPFLNVLQQAESYMFQITKVPEKYAIADLNGKPTNVYKELTRLIDQTNAAIYSKIEQQKNEYVSQLKAKANNVLNEPYRYSAKMANYLVYEKYKTILEELNEDQIHALIEYPTLKDVLEEDTGELAEKTDPYFAKWFRDLHSILQYTKAFFKKNKDRLTAEEEKGIASALEAFRKLEEVYSSVF